MLNVLEQSFISQHALKLLKKDIVCRLELRNLLQDNCISLFPLFLSINQQIWRLNEDCYSTVRSSPKLYYKPFNSL